MNESGLGEEIGKRMGDLRFERKMPAMEVAVMCHCHPNTVFSIERHSSEPTLQYAICFCEGMGITLNELVYGIVSPRKAVLPA